MNATGTYLPGSLRESLLLALRQSGRSSTERWERLQTAIEALALSKVMSPTRSVGAADGAEAAQALDPGVSSIGSGSPAPGRLTAGQALVVGGPWAALTDEELVLRFQHRAEGDNRAYRELFRRYQTMVWRVCYGFVRNNLDAEDLCQEAFLKAYRALDRFEGRSSFKTWIYRIAFTTGQNELRSRGRRPSKGDTPIEAMADRLPDSDLPEQGVIDDLPSEQMARALANLATDVVEILYLKDVHEMSYDEIAECLDIGLSAAKMRVHRARLALQSAFSQQVTAPPEPVDA
jgi:RNA polymerase sigma-70 factor (ECF subfamily)